MTKNHPEKQGSGEDDAELARRMFAGDHVAARLLVDKYAPRLKGFFVRKGASPEKAEDLVQEVWIKVIRATTFDPKRRFEPYVFRIARNHWIDGLRKLKEKSHVEFIQSDLPGVCELPLPIDRLFAEEHSAKIQRCYEDLVQARPEDRRLLDLRILQGMSMRQIAKIVEQTVDSIRAKVHRAVKRLGECLTEAGVYDLE